MFPLSFKAHSLSAAGVPVTEAAAGPVEVYAGKQAARCKNKGIAAMGPNNKGKDRTRDRNSTVPGSKVFPPARGKFVVW